MNTLSVTTKPRTSCRMPAVQNNHIQEQYITINDTAEKVYTVDEVFSRLEKNLNDFYGTTCKLR